MGEKDRISGRTKVLALIGSPVDHSMSPAMHNASFERMGVDDVYLVFDVKPEGLEKVVAAMKLCGFVGANVTMPCKTYVLEYLDEVSDAARLAGAVNTVKFEDGKACGYNTDGMGFMRNLKEHGFSCRGKKMVLVGAGGAGSAIFVQAAMDGVASIDVFNHKGGRSFEPAVARAAEVSSVTGCRIEVKDLDDENALRASVADADLFVNATSIGMAPDIESTILPVDWMHDDLVVADTIYSPRRTKLIRDAESRGLLAITGLGMLLWQAAIGERIWLGREMDVAFIKERFFPA